MKPIPRGVRLRMLLRSFAVQGSWNYETLVGNGFAFALMPALRYLYQGNGDGLRMAVARHAELFNSHPYLATVAVGAVSRLEAEGTDAAVIQRFKTALHGSLGSIGDRLVWTAWRPASVLLGILLLLMGAAWWVSILAFLIVYNTLHLVLRVGGLRIGSAAGLDVGRRLREAPLQSAVARAAQFGALLVGAAVVLASEPAFRDPLAAVATLAAVLCGLWLGRRVRRVMALVLAGVAAISIVVGFMGHGA